MTGTSAPPTDQATVEALRRVKAVEQEWETRLRDARENAEQAIRRARDEADATLKAVAAELESERAHRLEAAHAASQRDEEAVHLEGAKAAEAVRAGQGKLPTGRDAVIVATVLDPFSSD